MNVLTISSAMAAFLQQFSVWWISGNRDCQVTEWTAWSEPFGFGQISRERIVLQWASGFGEACPTELQEVIYNKTAPSTTEQAKHFAKSFFRFSDSTEGRAKRGSNVRKLRDLLVILDSSGSVDSGVFSDAKVQIGRLLALLCPHPNPFRSGYHQVAFMTFSENVSVIFQFNSYTSVSAIQLAMENAPYLGSSTCTATAFNYVEDMFKSTKGARKRPDVKQEVLIITDGKSNCGGDAVLAARATHKIADVFGLMVGDFDSSGKDEVINYVSYPSSQHLFYLKKFSEVKDFVDTVEKELQTYKNPCAQFDQ